MKKISTRLFWQPIFYPVLNVEYASEIAERWNRGDEDSDHAGFVTAFEIPEDYFRQFQIQTVGLDHHQELWVPDHQLSEFNDQIVNDIRVERSYFGKNFVVPDPLKGFFPK
ncbi:MAG TPA: hypothetical protein VIU12_11750 [Chryseolinea sp.]